MVSVAKANHQTQPASFMAEAQVAQANHETHGVNHTWTKYLLPAGGGVAAVQLYAGLAALHQRGTKERPRTKKT